MSIIQQGTNFTLQESAKAYNKLLAGNYMLKYDDRTGFYLHKKKILYSPTKFMEIILLFNVG
jgi:hypothetical protein